MIWTLIPSTYFPRHEDNRMKDEGNVTSARAGFLAQRPNNLRNLLEQRYEWMRQWIPADQVAIEIGSGHGLIGEFIKDRQILLTDVNEAPFIDKKVDALNLPFEPGTVDVFICSHMIHHLAHPIKFLNSLHRCLKPGGKVLISEINTSVMMRVLLRLLRHEGWSYDVDVFNELTACNQPDDPWSANCAIPQLLFRNQLKFHQNVDGFEIVLNELCECLAFPLSGGVISKSRTVQLPQHVLDLVNKVDRMLIRAIPGFFALGRRVVLKKKDDQSSRF